MNTLLLNALIWHVFLGLGGIVAFTTFLLLLTRAGQTLKWLKIYSILGVLAFLGSWISGGYYYTTYYGKAVKPVILAGSYSWVHKVLMEAKEHLFLFLPFLAFVVAIVVNVGGQELAKNEKLKRAMIRLSLLIVTLGLIITLSGMAISGAVTR